MSFDPMNLDLSAVYKRLAELEATSLRMSSKQAAMQAILERTPLNDEMKAAVELALRGEDWFEEMVEGIAKEKLDDMRRDLEYDLEKQINNEIASQVSSEVEHQMEIVLDDIKTEMRDLDHKIDELQASHDKLEQEHNDLSSKVDDLESTVEDLESTVEDLEGDDK